VTIVSALTLIGRLRLERVTERTSETRVRTGWWRAQWSSGAGPFIMTSAAGDKEALAKVAVAGWH
jgi:hypothetical protein